MKDFEETSRAIFRAAVKSNIQRLIATNDEIALVLASRSLVGRLDAVQLSRSVALIREPAWASVSVNLHEQLRQLSKDATIHLVSKLAYPLATNLGDYLDQPILGFTLPQWLKAAELMEQDRVLKAIRQGYGQRLTPLQVFEQYSPLSRSNSSVSSITVTSAIAVINRVAMDAAKQSGREEYSLWTAGKVKDPDIYKIRFAVGKGLTGPMFVGDRTVPVLS